MILYDYYRSTACYRVRIALHLKGINYDKQNIHLVQDGGEQFSSDYQEINPQSLVPTLIDKQTILTQSLAIIEYLDECHPKPNLLPTNPVGRAHVRALAYLIACDIHPLNNLRVTRYLKDALKADEEAVQTWYFEWLKRGFDAFEEKLNKSKSDQTLVDSSTAFFCYGKTISLADICLIPQVYNANRFGFSLKNYPLITEINDYCLTLDAFKQTAP